MDAWLEVIEATAGPLTPATRERLLNNDIAAIRAIVAHDRPDISGILPTMTMPFRLFAGSEDTRYENVKRAAFELPYGDFNPLDLNHFQVAPRGDLVAPLVTPYIIMLINEVEQNRHRKSD